MTEYENACVGCDYCVNCGATHTPYTVCDECGEDCRGGKVYEYAGQELCEGCAEEKMNDIWNELSVGERLERVCWDRDEFSSIYGAEAALDEYWEQANVEEKAQWFDDFKEVK